MDNKYRKDLKEKIMHYALDIKTNDTDEELNKCELNLRLLKFFKYEQNPEFETWFHNFCRDQEKHQEGQER